MPHQTPSFSDKWITDLARNLYGLEGELSPLSSFEDQNVRIKTSDGSYVLKISNKRWAIDGLHMQTEVFERLAARAPDLGVPRVVLTISGETLTMVEGFAVRLLTFIDGETLTTAPMSLALYRDLGRYMGRFTHAMQGFSHPAAHRPDDIWNLDNVMACKAYLPDVDDRGLRARLERLFSHYEKDVQPGLQYLRTSVIHHDANDGNLLVSPNDPTKIAGLIDFGDMEEGTLVNELAITLAYALFRADDIGAASGAIIQAFSAEFPLEKGELDVLFDLVAMRLVQSILVSSRRAQQFPDNVHILSSQEAVRALLEKLDTEAGLIRLTADRHAALT